MGYILSSNRRDEFLAVPELIRIESSIGNLANEPSILLKSTNLLLKYVVQGAKLKIHVELLQHCVLYACCIFEEPNSTLVLWSIVEQESEMLEINNLIQGNSSYLFLFNELALCVASAQINVSNPNTSENNLFTLLKSPINNDKPDSLVLGALDRIVNLQATPNIHYSSFLEIKSEWKSFRNNYITNELKTSTINLLHPDEGEQQEQLGLWLSDSLHPEYCIHSPQITESNRQRELIDVLLSYYKGTFLIESKTLKILSRENLPSRKKLSRSIESHVIKAIKQLKGAIKNVKNGTEITNIHGTLIDIERKEPIHAIILVPDLKLLQECSSLGTQVIREFNQDTNSFIHILDVHELLRVVQSALTISSNSKSVEPIMAFDFYLMERIKIASQNDNLCLEVLFRQT